MIRVAPDDARVLDPIPPDLSRKEFRQVLEARLEAASDRLLQEAAASPDAPPLPPTAVARLAELAGKAGSAA